MFWIIPAVVVSGGIILASRGARAANDSPDTDRGERPDIIVTPGQVNVRELAADIGAPDPWIDFFDVCFWGESRHRTDVGLGITNGAPPWVEMNKSASEAKAAKKVYTSNLKSLAPCVDASLYAFGSGGLGAMLPAAAVAAFKGDPLYNCVHPWSIFDPQATMIYAAWFARRLQGWKQWTGTALSMRVMWGNPSAGSKTPDAKKLAKWSRHCEERDIDPDFLFSTLPRWKPAPAPALWQATGVDNGWLPQAALEAA